MNDRRLNDDALARALRAYLPAAPEAGLHGRILAAIEPTPQQRPLPFVLGALSDADPARRRTTFIIAAALLVALAFATAVTVGALLERQHSDPIEQLDLAPPLDLDAFMTASYLGIRDLPALKVVMSDGDTFYHDGAGTVRQDRGTELNWTTWIYSATRTIQVVRIDGGRWVVGPPAGSDPRLQIFLAGTCCSMDPACETGWRYIGLEYVIGRPTHHVACRDERWVDVELGIPLRSKAEAWRPTLDPSGMPSGEVTAGPSSAADVASVAVLEIGPQPAPLFAENPDGLEVATADAFRCANGGPCGTPVAFASQRPTGPPPRAAVHGAPPADLAAFIAEVHAGYAALPALEMITDAYSIPPDSETRIRWLWDGADSTRTDYFDGAGWKTGWLTIDGRTYENWPGPNDWHEYPPSRGALPEANPETSMGLPTECPTGWQHRGFDLVGDGPAHHVVCDREEFWIDQGSLRVVRVQHDPDPLGAQVGIEVLVSMTFGPQPPELFALPEGARVYCPGCHPPTTLDDLHPMSPGPSAAP